MTHVLDGLRHLWLRMGRGGNQHHQGCSQRSREKDPPRSQCLQTARVSSPVCTMVVQGGSCLSHPLHSWLAAGGTNKYKFPVFSVQLNSIGKDSVAINRTHPCACQNTASVIVLVCSRWLPPVFSGFKCLSFKWNILVHVTTVLCSTWGTRETLV